MSLSIQDELNALIAKNLASQTPTEEPFKPVLDANGNPLETPTTPAPEPKVVEDVKPVETPVVPEPTKPVAEADIFEDWENTGTSTEPVVPPATEPTAPTFDFSKLAKELGKEDIKAEDEVIKAVQEIKAKAEMLSNVPDDLAKAMEIAKAGGNYLEYLQVSVVDWAKEDPIVLYENYVEDQFYNPETGLVDYEKVDKVLDKMDDEEKEFRGKELQKQYVTYQKQQQEFLRQDAQAKKVAFENSVRGVINEIKDVNGYVLSPSKKAQLLDYVLSGEDLRENDVKSRVVNAFIKQNFSSIDQYMKTKVRNSTQREILNEAQVPEIKPSSTPAPADTSNKPYSISDWISDLQKQKGF